MDQVQLTQERNNEIDWRQRCHDRMERLKSIQFPIQVAPSPQSRLIEEEYFVETKCMPLELYQVVQFGDVYGFLDLLEQICKEKSLPLSAIFDQVTRRGDSLLHLAAFFGKENIAELIAFHFPHLLTKKNIRGSTVLHEAASSMNPQLVDVLLSQHATQRSKFSSSLWANEDVVLTRCVDENGNTPLHVAVNARNPGVVAKIFGADEPVTLFVNKFSQSPLYVAILHSNMEIVDRLMPKHSFPDDMPLSKCRGNPPLYAAIINWKKASENSALLKKLVEKKRELINLRDENGGTALHFAAYMGYVEGVKILSKEYNGLTLEWDAKGYLPIHVACERGHVKVVEALFQQSHNHFRDLLTREGENILHVAVKKGAYHMVKYLMKDKKVDINKRDNDGNTPLHLASKGPYPNILFLLTQESIDLEARNKTSSTSADILTSQASISTPLTHNQILSFEIMEFAGVKLTDKVENTLRHHEGNWIKSRADKLMLLSILIITVSFTAGFTVPGGLFSSDDGPNRQGMAIFVNQPMFQIYVILNTTAMYTSTAGTFSLFWATHLGDFNFFFARHLYRLSFALLGTSLASMSVAFMVSVHLVVRNVTWLANVVTIIGIIFLLGILVGFLMGILFYGTHIRFMRPVTYLVLWLHVSLSEDYGAKETSISNDQHVENNKDKEQDIQQQRVNRGKSE